MIDIIINEFGGLTLAHDEKALDEYDTVEISMLDGTMCLSGHIGTRKMPVPLKPSMLEMVRDGMEGRSVRLSGWSLAKIRPLIVSIRR